MELTDDHLRTLKVVPMSHPIVAAAAACSEERESVKTLWTFNARVGEDKCDHCNHCTHTK